jgi:hypothetical protein
VKALFVSSVKIEDNSGVEMSSYVSKMFDACVETFESTIELFIGVKVGDGILIESKE